MKSFHSYIRLDWIISFRTVSDGWKGVVLPPTELRHLLFESCLPFAFSLWCATGRRRNRSLQEGEGSADRLGQIVQALFCEIDIRGMEAQVV